MNANETCSARMKNGTGINGQGTHRTSHDERFIETTTGRIETSDTYIIHENKIQTGEAPPCTQPPRCSRPLIGGIKEERLPERYFAALHDWRPGVTDSVARAVQTGSLTKLLTQETTQYTDGSPGHTFAVLFCACSARSPYTKRLRVIGRRATRLRCSAFSLSVRCGTTCHGRADKGSNKTCRNPL